MAGAQLGGLPVSAPGANSTRTDQQPMRDLPDAGYGENKEFREMQAGAPMAATPAPPSPVGLFEPSQRPGEPVSYGANFGEGPGSEALVRPPAAYTPPTLTSTLQKLASIEPNNERMSALLALVERQGW